MLPYIYFSGETVKVEQVFASFLILNSYRDFGCHCFSIGYTVFTEGNVIFKRIKNLLLLKDLKIYENARIEKDKNRKQTNN